MADLRVDDRRMWVEVDLHGYGLRVARGVAREKIREAWVNGFSRITLIHGGGSARRRGAAWRAGYGVMKWQLRGLLESGKWRRFLYHTKSSKHRLDEGFMRLALRPNPAPLVPPLWTPLPAEEFGGGDAEVRP